MECIAARTLLIAGTATAQEFRATIRGVRAGFARSIEKSTSQSIGMTAAFRLLCAREAHSTTNRETVMKTFTKTLLAAGVGVFGICGAANAGTPYGSFTSTQDIAVGGCYQPVNCTYYEQYGGDYGSGYRPGTSYEDHIYRPLPARPVYDDSQSYHTLPFPANRDYVCDWDATARNQRRYDDFNVNLGSTWFNRSPVNLDRSRFESPRYEHRYDGSPSFEPWRPMSASQANYRW